MKVATWFALYSTMGCSLIAILDLKGKVSRRVVRRRDEKLRRESTQSLIQRSYRDDIPASAIERFLPLILDQEEDIILPCFSSEGVNYLHIRHNNLYRSSSFFLPPLFLTTYSPHHTAVVALTKKNSNAAELLTFLHKLVSVSSRPTTAQTLVIDSYDPTGPHRVLQGARGGVHSR